MALVGERSHASSRADASRDRPPGWVLPVLVTLGCALRGWGAFSHGMTFDETFTAMAARRGPVELLRYLRDFDAHPPLDYLLRWPLAQAGAPDAALRAPSVLFSCAALVLFAWWMRERGWFGASAVALFAASTFQVFYGSEVRMYALLQLLGVATAIVAERWLRAPAHWHARAVAALLALALLDHGSALVFAVGLLALAGWRTDRVAWRWRVGVGAGVAIWLLLWGAAFAEQIRNDWAAWIPPTTLARVPEVVARHVTWEGVGPLVLVAAVTGTAVLLARDRPLGVLVAAAAGLPFAVAAVVGAVTSFFFDKTLTLSSWAVPLACAAAIAWVAERWRVVGATAAVLAVVFTFAGTVGFLATSQWDYDDSIARLERRARAGDVLAVQPARYGDLVEWRLGVRGTRPTSRVTVGGLPDSRALRIDDPSRPSAPTRVWLLRPVRTGGGEAAFGRCAPRWTNGVSEILCLEAAP